MATLALELLRKNRADRPGPKSQKRKRNWMDEIPDFKNQLSTVLIPTAQSGQVQPTVQTFRPTQGYILCKILW